MSKISRVHQLNKSDYKIIIIMKKYKLGLILGLIVITALLIVGYSTNVVKAAISAFSPSNCYTAAATTSPAYMSGGVATSTVTCNMSPNGALTAVIAIEVNASSTSSIFNTYVEESMDGLDWFPTRVASSTRLVSTDANTYYSYTFASSTLKGVVTPVLGVAGLNNRNHYSFDVPVRMKYVRAYTVIPIGSNPGAVWMQIIPRQDIN